MASTNHDHGVLAGFDGSPGSEQAVLWAMNEARARAAVLTVCHAWAPGYAVLPEEEYAAAFDLVKRCGERTLAGGVALARTLYQRGEVRPLLAAGAAAEVLCTLSVHAAMVVVGSRGHSGLAGLLAGSVSSQVAAHAAGPVVVVRGHWRHVPGRAPRSVVVGTDGSQGSEPAVEFAFAEAALHSSDLLAVCAPADAVGHLGGVHHIADDFARQLDRWQKEYPDVVVRRRVTGGPARPALLAAAHQAAQLVVVGARGRGVVPGMLLGSVSQALLNHAPCPVAIVHPPPTAAG